MLLPLLLSQSLALAADPVVAAGDDPRVTLTRAAAATGRPAEELRAVTFPELASVHPAVIEGGGLVEECRGLPTTMGTVRDTLDRAERALAYLEFDKAQAHLALGHGQLRCLAEPADARDAAKLYFLTGFVAASTQREAEARTAFARTLAFNPSFTWDNTYPPDGQELLDGLRDAGASGRTELTVLPVSGRSDLWVDGKPAQLTDTGSVELDLGPHLIQVTTSEITSYWVDLRADEAEAAPAAATEATTAAAAAEGEAAADAEGGAAADAEGEAAADAEGEAAADAESGLAGAYQSAGPLFGGAGGVPSERVQQLSTQHVLVAPALLPLDAAAWAMDDSKRDELMLMLASMMDPESLVYFSSGGELVQHTVGTPQWDALKVPTNLARAVSGPAGRHAAGRTLFWTGTAATAGGLGVMGVAWLQANSAVNRAKGTADFPVYDLARTDHTDAAGLMTIGRFVGLGGVVLTATGVGLQFDNLPGIFGGGKRGRTASATVVPVVDRQTVGLGVTVW